MKDTCFLRHVLGTAYLATIFGISIITWTSSDFAEVAHLAPPPAGEGFSFTWNPLALSSRGCTLDQKSKFKIKKVCSFTDTDSPDKPTVTLPLKK